MTTTNNIIPITTTDTSLTTGASSQLTASNSSGVHTSEFSPSVAPGTTVINQRGFDSRSASSSFNQFFGGDDDDSIASDEDENDILLPFRNAVVYSRTDNHQRHSKNVFEFIVILLCLVPTTIFSVSASSVYVMIDSFLSEYAPNNEKSLANFLQAQFLSVIVIITFIEFVKFLLVLVISVLFAFVVKVYTLDSHLTGGVKKNHKFFQYFHENLTNNPFCCLIGLTCCVLTGYITFNIGLTYSIISLFITNITPEFSHLTNVKIATLINVLDWVLFILYFIVYFKLQQKQKTLHEHNTESEDEYYDDSGEQNVFESISNTFTSTSNRAPSSSDNNI